MRDPKKLMAQQLGTLDEARWGDSGILGRWARGWLALVSACPGYESCSAHSQEEEPITSGIRLPRKPLVSDRFIASGPFQMQQD